MGLDLSVLPVSVAGDRITGPPAEQSDAGVGYREMRITLAVDIDTDDQMLGGWLTAVEECCALCETLFEATPSIIAVSNRET